MFYVSTVGIGPSPIGSQSSSESNKSLMLNGCQPIIQLLMLARFNFFSSSCPTLYSFTRALKSHTC